MFLITLTWFTEHFYKKLTTCVKEGFSAKKTKVKLLTNYLNKHYFTKHSDKYHVMCKFHKTYKVFWTTSLKWHMRDEFHLIICTKITHSCKLRFWHWLLLYTVRHFLCIFSWTSVFLIKQISHLYLVITIQGIKILELKASFVLEHSELLIFLNN